MANLLPAIPAKRYFTIGEVSDLCCVKPYVLRYWEQEFTQLRPMKRRGNRRYYQHHEVLLIRRIRTLLYEHGFTISGARNKLGVDPDVAAELSTDKTTSTITALANVGTDASHSLAGTNGAMHGLYLPATGSGAMLPGDALRAELVSLRNLLTV